jgi:hypothetical protein
MDLNSLLDNPPKINEVGDHKLVCWLLPRPVLDFINARVNERSITLETGCGLSTIVFAMGGGSHTSVT